jgi:putative transposase
MKLFIPEEVITNFVDGARLPRGERGRLLGEKSERSWEIPHSGRTRISRTTILDWVRKNERGDLRMEAPFPKDRKDRGNSLGLDEEAVLILRKVRQEMRAAPVIRLIEEMKSRGWIEKGDRLNPSTVYRFLKGQGLMSPLEFTP